LLCLRPLSTGAPLNAHVDPTAAFVRPRGLAASALMPRVVACERISAMLRPLRWAAGCPIARQSTRGALKFAATIAWRARFLRRLGPKMTWNVRGTAVRPSSGRCVFRSHPLLLTAAMGGDGYCWCAGSTTAPPVRIKLQPGFPHQTVGCALEPAYSRVFHRRQLTISARIDG